MSDTPETNSIIRNAQAADHPPTRLAATLTVKCEKLERERDEARESTLRIDVLNFKLRKELDDAKSKIKSQADRIRYLEGATNHAKGTPLSVALRERDEARESLKHITEYGTDEINAAVELRQKLATALVERDEAREKIERQADIGCSFQKTNPAMCGRYKQERDESQEKYATEATEHMLAVNKLCNERDEAREEIKRLKVILDLIKKDVS